MENRKDIEAMRAKRKVKQSAAERYADPPDAEGSRSSVSTG